MQFTWDHIHYLEVSPYQNVKSIRQAVCRLSRSQAISCIGYNVNLQTAVVAILVLVECPKSIVRGLSGIKAILKSDKQFSRYHVHKQLWTDGWTDRATP